MEQKKPRQNIVGRQVARIRNEMALTQELLAARCCVAGWDISRGTLAKIEAGVRCVSDREVAMLAIALKTPVHKLYPGAVASRLVKLS